MSRILTSGKFSLNFKYFIYLIVFIGFGNALSGAYEDFFNAIDRDDDKKISLLLQRGFDPNTPNPQLQSALNVALQQDKHRVVDVLLTSRQLKVNQPNDHDETPLMMAALRNRLDVVQKLVALGADVNRPGWTALHYAASQGHVQVIRYLLDQHAYIDAESPNGTTPLMMAAHYGTPAATKLLLEEGADPLLLNQKGLSALDFAQAGPHTESTQYIEAFVRAVKARRGQ